MSMNTKHVYQSVFDPLLGYLESFLNANAVQLLARWDSIGAEISKTIVAGLSEARSRVAQFRLIRAAVDRAREMFRDEAEKISKETLMSIARRAPVVFLDGAELALSRLIIKYAKPNPRMSFIVRPGEHDLALLFSEDDVITAMDLIAIAKCINKFEGMARWLGKGGKLSLSASGTLHVKMPADVRAAVENYERRRPRNAAFDAGGFFLRQPEPKDWSDLRVPTFIRFEGGRYFEAPKGSARWLYFERWPSMLDAGGLARLLRGYDEALKESWGAGADTILHFMTALATLIHHSSPTINSSGENYYLEPQASPQELEHSIGFVFGLARKGYLRLPAASVIESMSRVRTTFAAEAETGKRLAKEFIDAFRFRPDQVDLIDPSIAHHTPFLHQSTDDYLYIDLLLLWDFLAGVLEGGKQWFAGQHGDRFTLDLKRWLDVEAPGSVLAAKVPVPLPNGAMSDIDLLVKGPNAIWIVECKAYGKSPEFLIGSPTAVAARRRRIRAAVQQADRIAEVFSAHVTAGQTDLAPGTKVAALVCTPSVEFLKPLEEYGMISTTLPRVVTPEELLEFLAE